MERSLVPTRVFRILESRCIRSVLDFHDLVSVIDFVDGYELT